MEWVCVPKWFIKDYALAQTFDLSSINFFSVFIVKER